MKAFDTTWHTALPHKLPELEFLTCPIKLIASFLTDKKCKAFVEEEFSTPRKIEARVP
jgi:hypothetical protein